MNGKIRRTLMRRNRKLLIPTRITIFVCAVFFSVCLMMGRFFLIAVGQTRMARFTGTEYRLTEKNGEEGLTYDQVKEKEASLPKGISVCPDWGVYLLLSFPAKPDSSDGIRVRVEPAPASPEQSPFPLEEGTYPKTAEEIVLPASVRDRYGVKLGEEVSLSREGGVLKGSGSAEEQETRKELARRTISGFCRFKDDGFLTEGVLVSPDSIEALRPEADLRPKQEERIRNIYIYSAPASGPNAAELRTRCAELFAPVYRLESLEEAVERDFNDAFRGEVNPVTLIGLVFVMLAVGVGCLVISNTFRVLVARQRHTYALLRAIGAQSRQIYWMVLRDGLSLGIFSSLAGALLPCSLLALFQALRLRIGNLLIFNILRGEQIFCPVLVLSLTTMLAVLGAARSSTRVAPIEALRPLEISESDTLRKKVGLGTLLLSLIGGGICAFSFYSIREAAALLAREETPSEQSILTAVGLGILGSFLVLLAILISGRVWIPAVLRGLGRLSAKASYAVAAAGIRKNPRRSSVTGTAILIGVVLVASIMTGASSTSQTIENQVNERFAVDLFAGFKEQGTAEELNRSLSENKKLIRGTTIVPMAEISFVGTKGEAGESAQRIRLLFPTREQENVLRRTLPNFAPGELWVPSAVLNRHDVDKKDGDTVQVKLTDGSVRDLTLRVDDSLARFAPEENAQVAFSRDEQVQAASRASQFLLWVRTDDRASLGDLVKLTENQLVKRYAPKSVGGSVFIRIQIRKAIRAVMYVLFALIGVTVLIAVIGIANTLILSVIERRRETATLRVIGMTREQLRSSLGWEAVLLASVGIVFGILCGIGFGFFGTYILLGGTVGKVIFSVSPLGLLTIAVIGFFCSWGASVFPAREALRTSPIEALAE